MVGSSNERDEKSTAGLLPKIGFALATLVLLVSLLAMAFGERRGIVYLILALLMYWQSWALATTGSSLRKRIASRWIALSVWSPDF